MTATSGPLRAILYHRVSTSRQAESGAGIDAQRATTRAYAETVHGWEVVADLDENGTSGMMRPSERPVLGAAIEDLAAGRADVLVVSKLDRLGRKAQDILDLAEEAESGGWSLVAIDIGIDTSSPVGRVVLTVLAGISRFERDMAAQRTREALAALKRRGGRLGRPVDRSPENQTARDLVAQHQRDGLSLSESARRMTAAGIATARGGIRWWPSTISGIRESLRLDREAEAARSGKSA